MKRKTLEVQREVFDFISKNPGITLSTLERKIRTNPKSLKEHCQQLAFFKLVKIKRTKETTILTKF
jgi:predicted transcriptional regulator